MNSAQSRKRTSNLNNNKGTPSKTKILNELRGLYNESSSNEPRELIITDYNPFDINEVYEDGTSLPVITQQINPV